MSNLEIKVKVKRHWLFPAIRRFLHRYFHLWRYYIDYEAGGEHRTRTCRVCGKTQFWNPWEMQYE